jgi:hypothetical protein
MWFCGDEAGSVDQKLWKGFPGLSYLKSTKSALDGSSIREFLHKSRVDIVFAHCITFEVVGYKACFDTQCIPYRCNYGQSEVAGENMRRRIDVDCELTDRDSIYPSKSTRYTQMGHLGHWLHYLHAPRHSRVSSRRPKWCLAKALIQRGLAVFARRLCDVSGWSTTASLPLFTTPSLTTIIHIANSLPTTRSPQSFPAHAGSTAARPTPRPNRPDTLGKLPSCSTASGTPTSSTLQPWTHVLAISCRPSYTE